MSAHLPDAEERFGTDEPFETEERFESDEPFETTERPPVVAVVGRPNVGKSTLVNRIIGQRAAVVEDVPGVTRDRVSYRTEWNGRVFDIVDTGGWMPDATGLTGQIAVQVDIALDMCDAVLFVVDASVGVTNEDLAVVRRLRNRALPILLVANKSDDLRGEWGASELWSLGLGEPHPVSALHGRGSGDLLDALVAILPAQSRQAAGVATAARLTLVGRPNVGKSSLLNALAGGTRAIVDAVAGTTVDPVDEEVDIAGTGYVIVDTAGIRRRVARASGTEYYASVRTRMALEQADLALFVLDGSEPLTDQDRRLLTMIEESGRALVIVVNKWDLVDDERRLAWEREFAVALQSVSWAPRVNLSALTGWHIGRLGVAIASALAGWRTRIPTGELNAVLAEAVASHPHPIRGGRQPRILYATQASSAPPTVVLFTTAQLDDTYLRFIERRLREEFGFAGSPVRLTVRQRSRRDRGPTLSG